MQVQWLHFDLGDQELELELNAFTVIGVSDAAARNQLCSVMARSLSRDEAGTSVRATLDDGSRVNVQRRRDASGTRQGERCAEHKGRRSGTKWPVESISSELRADPERLIVERQDVEDRLDSQLSPVIRLRRSHRWAELLALVVAISLPVMCMVWLASLPLLLVSFLFVLSLVPAFVWRYCGARLSCIEDDSIGEVIAARQVENHRLSSGETVPTIVNFPRLSWMRRRKRRILENLRPVSETGQLIVVTDDAEMVYLAKSTTASVIESARAHT